MCKRHRSRLVAPLVLAAIFLTGCPRGAPSMPDRIWELSQAGVVESVEELDGGGLRVALAGGESLELTPSDRDLYGELVIPGELLLVASSGSSRAYATLGIVLRECFVWERQALDDGSHIVFDLGLRLPKASEFDPGPADDGLYPSFREGFCINASGAVVSYGS